MAMNYRDEVYKPRLAMGLEYQDFLCVELHKRGIVLQNLQSQKYQLKSENLLGMEIKFDDKLAKTGNIYIEVAEKSDPANPRYVPSGIYREDDTWLYAIGNYSELFIFAKTMLKMAYENKKYARLIPENATKTSQGFLLSRVQAEKWAAIHIQLEGCHEHRRA